MALPASSRHSSMGSIPTTPRPGAWSACGRQDETSREWTTAEGLFARIEEWCENEKNGWERDQLRQDAFLNFTSKLPERIAVV